MSADLARSHRRFAGPWLSLILFGLAFQIATLPAAPLVAGEPEQLDLGSRVDELYADQHRSDAPGGVVAVIENGRIVHETAFGMADLERGVAITTDSVFEIGSISKQFTAMCILLLELDGKLSVEDDVRKYVKELSEYERPITIRHLLHHTSGIRDIETLIPLAGIPWMNYSSHDDMLELVFRQRGLNFPPGDQYLYSNSGYLLLAEIVERVSGLSLRDFAANRIFEPLGMRSTQFWDHPSQIIERRAIAYEASADGGWDNALWYNPFAGPAGVYTSAGDLARWDANFYDNRLGGGAELIARMETPGLLESGEEIEYAMGLMVESYRDQRMVSHGGAWMGYRASLERFPDQRLTIVALSNGARGLGSFRVANLYLDERLGRPDDEAESETSGPFEPPPTVARPAKELARYEGVYWNETEAVLRRIELRDGALHYVRGEENASPLGALEEGDFVMIGPAMRVDVAFENDAREMTVVVEGQEPLHFQRLEPPSSAASSSLTGSFWSAELDRELQLGLVDGKVVVSWADEATTAPAVMIGTNELLVQEFVAVPWYPQDVRLRLTRDGSGAVVGLTLSCDMVRGVVFEKR